MKVKTFLPVFKGFYGSYWDEIDLQSEVEHIKDRGLYETKFLTYFLDDYSGLENLLYKNLNWPAYYIALCKKFCKIIENEIDLVKSITYEEMISPKEYNFSNDSINCIIDIKKRPFKKWLFDNKEIVNQKLKDRYTSCSGFISFYPRSFEGWKEETNNFKDLDGHYLGALLDIYCEVEEINEDVLYNDTEIYFSEFIDYDKVIEEIKDPESPFELVEKFEDPNQLTFCLSF